MGIPIESLPPKAREQVARKLMQNGGHEVPTAKHSKFGNKKAVRMVGDVEITFDSQKEARRYDELMLRYRAGEIRDLKLQPEFTLRETYTTPEGLKVRAIRYRADFSYEERVPILRGFATEKSTEDLWRSVVEDVKSPATKTRVYEIKKKLLIEQRGITIREI